MAMKHKRKKQRIELHEAKHTYMKTNKIPEKWVTHAYGVLKDFLNGILQPKRTRKNGYLVLEVGCRIDCFTEKTCGSWFPMKITTDLFYKGRKWITLKSLKNSKHELKNQRA